MTHDDLIPRPEFAGALRDRFVDELCRPDARIGTAVPPREVTDIASSGPTRRPADRRWRPLVSSAALIVGLVAGLVVLSTRDAPGADEIPAATQISTPEPAPLARLDEICASYGGDPLSLPLGADEATIEATATALSTRLRSADRQLSAISDATGVDASDARRLLGEALDATDQLTVAAATGDRAVIDRAVSNVDLIVIAWAREMRDLTGSSECDAVPTLREVF